MLSLTACGRRCVIDKALFGHAITILGVLVLSPDSLTVRLVAGCVFSSVPSSIDALDGHHHHPSCVVILHFTQIYPTTLPFL